MAFLTLGCKVNAYETEGMKKQFREAGFDICDFQEKADIYIINTCSVTNMADRKSRQMIHRARKNNEQALVVATGCYVQAQKEALLNEQKLDLVVGNNKKSEIVELVLAELKQKEAEYERARFEQDIIKEAEYEELMIENAGERTRAYIKVQDGCNQFCSYCIIPYVRGKIRSRKPEQVLLEVEGLAKKGYKEIVVTGIHLSSYGIDFEGGQDFTRYGGKPLLSLLSKLEKVEKIERIRLGSLEPRIITEEFLKELSKLEKVCPHFHLSLQSGCDETLKRMNRKYTTAEYLEGCERIRSYYEHPAITTDVIAGFVGESEEEFETTRKFLEKVQFSDVHIFKYSRRNGTNADRMEGHIGENIKTERSAKLIELGLEMKKAYNEWLFGREQKVLFEEDVIVDGKEYVAGHNERYVKYLKPKTKENIHNEIVTVTATKMLEDGTLLCG
ncbi:MAG: tRNA (N(6)-L-threonylcarbamoyladenosine(37)-C(2))-methylthiotransferase MtaB [Lachnospiraceae bacterium]|nr:tRNA (N(6)-L-threonylcarbamoyladenosine(37)-C(2))-methylthiotransferase MtaB [Lachnospiraceae bacterium]